MSEGKIIARRREDRPEVLYLVISNPKALNALTEEMQIRPDRKAPRRPG